jgi:hypothetical protein
LPLNSGSRQAFGNDSFKKTTKNIKQWTILILQTDQAVFYEFGGVNPSISDSSTYTFLSAKTMFDTLKEIWKAVLKTIRTIPLDQETAMFLGFRNGSDYANVITIMWSG